jgi:small basic protein
MVGCRNDATFDSYVFVYVFLQCFVVVIDIAFVLDHVAVRSVIRWVDRDNVTFVARVLDFLGRELGFVNV